MEAVKLHPASDLRRRGPVVAAATMLGIGMGGFVDGIVLHQILQWHEMLSAKLPPDNLTNKSINMFWDGIFHAFTWIITAIGIAMLWNLHKKQQAVLFSGKIFIGGLIFGWGLFNLIEGVIDHYLLNIHNVRELSPDPQMWNHGFTVFSIILLIVGWLMIRATPRRV